MHGNASMFRFAICFVVPLVYGLAVPVQAQWIPRCTHTRAVCCLSDRYCYDHSSVGPPITAVTFSGLDYQERASGWSAGEENMSVVTARRFSLRQPELLNSHCRLTHVAVTLNESGHWSLDCTAEQNPSLAGPTEQAGLNVFTGNKLYIRLRPLIGESLPGPENLDQVQAPSAASISLGPVWLKRGEVKRLRFEGHRNAGVARSFAEIRFVAVDLSFE